MVNIPKQNLRTPGPTPVPSDIVEAMSNPMIDHRGPEFLEGTGHDWVWQPEMVHAIIFLSLEREIKHCTHDSTWPVHSTGSF